MKRMNLKALLLLMMLVTCMLLTGCYKEVDPWPASAPVATELPPTAAPTPEVIIAPTATPQPVPEPAEEDEWADEQPTQVPGGEVDPGFNG